MIKCHAWIADLHDLDLSDLFGDITKGQRNGWKVAFVHDRDDQEAIVWYSGKGSKKAITAAYQAALDPDACPVCGDPAGGGDRCSQCRRFGLTP
jgi:hypothetical protein